MRTSRWPRYVPRELDVKPSVNTAQPHLDRTSLLSLIVQDARAFLSDAANASGADLVSLVQERGVAESIEAYVAYADRPYDVSGIGGVRSGVALQRLECDVNDLVYDVLQLLFIKNLKTWMPAAATQTLGSLVSLASVMDIASLYYYKHVTREKMGVAKITTLEEMLDGMIGLAAMRDRKGVTEQLTEVAENVSEVAMRVIDALAAPNGHQDTLDGVTYLRDACLTLSCVLGACGSLRRFIVQQNCLDRLLNALDDVHDGLVPKLYFFVGESLNHGNDGDFDGGDLVFREQCSQLECSAGSAAGWLFDGLMSAPLEIDESRGSSSRGNTSASIHRGEMLLEALCMLKGREGMDLEAGGGLASALAAHHGLAGRIGMALEDRRVALDDAQREYMLVLLGMDAFEDAVEDEDVSANTMEMGGAAAAIIGEKTPLIQQVEEVLPGMYGAGFLAACLDSFGDSPERVIDALLAGGVPAGMEAVDAQLDLAGYLATVNQTNDDKDAKVVEEFPELVKKPSVVKKKAHAATSRVLDTMETSYKDRLRSAIIAAQWEEQEYDDEYDDSYDDVVKGPQDLGGGEESGGVQGGPPPPSGMKSPEPNARSQKLWIMDNKVYNYEKRGARAVSSREEADAVLAEQKLAKLEIHGLGPQGNKHVAVAPDTRSKKPAGNPNSKNRAGFKEKHKAAIGNHHRKERASRKQERAGGP